jgi:hypothetical protein
MSENLQNFESDEIDEIAEFVKREHISAECVRIDIRPDVSAEEQALWIKQDPDFPPEHYRCQIRFQEKELELYQTVGADYPDEDEEADNSDLYRDSRQLLLSPEFLVESAALKANSVDEADDLQDWIKRGYCESETPELTYQQFRQIRQGLLDLLGVDRYRTLLELAVTAELERDEESEEWT